MNNILKIALTLAVGIVLAGCYNDFDNPAPAKVYTDKDFTETGAEIISIKDLKAKFYEKWGHDANGLGRRVVIEDDVVIKGKVISSDAEGNVYKSLYIYDGEQAIELRLMNDNYVNYPLGQIVYVKAQGLSLASYRYMLSLGAAPALEPDGTFPNDTPSEHDFSASGNSNIPTTEMVQQYVYRGELDTITEADVTVVDKDNYKTVLNDDLLGCLIRFEGLRSSYTTVDSNKMCIRDSPHPRRTTSDLRRRGAVPVRRRGFGRLHPHVRSRRLRTARNQGSRGQAHERQMCIRDRARTSS